MNKDQSIAQMRLRALEHAKKSGFYLVKTMKLEFLLPFHRFPSSLPYPTNSVSESIENYLLSPKNQPAINACLYSTYENLG
jgi:hypothetical protein